MRELTKSWSRALRYAGIAVVAAAVSVPVALAQSHEGDRDWDHGRLTRIEPGTRIDVRTDERIDVNRYNDRFYPGRVEHDVFGENGRLVIPRGAPVELAVRVAADNDLVLDLNSVTVRGDRFALDTRPDRIQSERMHGIIGAIAGAAGVQVRGPAVNVPRDTLLSFRIERPPVWHAVHEGPSGQ